MNEDTKETGSPIGPQASKIEASASENTPGGDPPPAFYLDDVKPINPDSFPDQREGNSGKKPPTTIPNIEYMLSVYGITPRYDVIGKRLQIHIPGLPGCPDNANNSAMTQIISLVELNNLSVGRVESYVAAIGDKNHFNPVKDWIICKQWDGNDRLQLLYDTLEVREKYPKKLKELLLRKWLLSAIASALKPTGFRARGVLTLQGPQSIGKTAWVSALVSDPVLRDAVVKLDHHLDPSSKDSLITAFTHWIVELGELEDSLNKSIARLKSCISGNRDKIRRPYARAISDYQRRTIFCATVNNPNFLVDDTGNTRWWTIPVASIDYEHGINMQQLFSQLAVHFKEGESWWLSQEEEQLLEEQNKDHRRVSVIRDWVFEALDLSLTAESLPAMTATEVLQKVGFNKPTNPQTKECAGALREYLGEPKKIRGRMKWRVPLRKDQWSPSFQKVDDIEQSPPVTSG